MLCLLAGCGNPIDVPGQPRDEERECWLPERFVGEAESPGLFTPDVVCALAPDTGVVYRFSSATFAALLGWEGVACPTPDADCPNPG